VPTPSDTGAICRACRKGHVIEVSNFHQTGELVIGGRTPGYTSSDYHCNSCGLVYRFPPPSRIRKPEIGNGRIQIRPGEMVEQRLTREEEREAELSRITADSTTALTQAVKSVRQRGGRLRFE
jgi:hypothetical protein